MCLIYHKISLVNIELYDQFIKTLAYIIEKPKHLRTYYHFRNSFLKDVFLEYGTLAAELRK